MNKKMIPVNCIVMFFILFTGSISAVAVEYDVENVKFHGASCKSLSVDDVAVDEKGRLVIDLSNAIPIETAPEDRTCLIFVPLLKEVPGFSGDLKLAGQYQTANGESVVVTAEVAKRATSKKPAFNTIERSVAGDFVWGYPVNVHEEKPVKDFKISITTGLFSNSEPSSEESDSGGEGTLLLALSRLVLTLD